MAKKQHKSTKKQAKHDKVEVEELSVTEGSSAVSVDDDDEVHTIPSLPKPDAEPLPDITEIPDRWWTLTDAQGYGSVTLTMAVVSFFITTVWFILSIFKIGSEFSPTACNAYFGMIITTYVARKYTESKHKPSNKGK